MPNRETIPIEDVRLAMLIKLKLTPGHVFKLLWQPNGVAREEMYLKIISELTRGWEDYEITRPEVAKMTPFARFT